MPLPLRKDHRYFKSLKWLAAQFLSRVQDSATLVKQPPLASHADARFNTDSEGRMLLTESPAPLPPVLPSLCWLSTQAQTCLAYKS